jgi:hypothetical protein
MKWNIELIQAECPTITDAHGAVWPSNNEDVLVVSPVEERRTLISKPGAAIECWRINLTEEEKKALSTGGAQIPSFKRSIAQKVMQFFASLLRNLRK